ncbi:MAG: histone deacetylase [Betaproteobacteria bacterium]|jgi:acetoin utilization deacetylase AcuC-like enzyme|nr:histone deacetylase [Betaproteobacteria bacterium]NDD00652.1 histone deacetylase [Betaproteobacteria bacterium]NDE25782.1 histone deacetylase [Betaproteobacteria bacterium]
MKAFYSDHFVLPLPEGHRFPMAKYSMLRERIARELRGVQLMEAPAATEGELALAHSPDYVWAVKSGSLSPQAQREIGFPWTPAMAERSVRSAGASIAAGRVAMREGIAGNLAGGTHHASANQGGGFCVFNDIAVTARVLQMEQFRATKQNLQVLVIDLDVHQGNGTAAIFATDPSVFTLSLHGEKNFPFRKVNSDLDVGLPDGCSDEAYSMALENALAQVLQRFQPQFVIYLAGADAHEGDRLGRLKLTEAGMKQRDLQVFDWVRALGLPMLICMGGGYGHDLTQTVQVQMNTWQLAMDHWLHWQNRVL